MADKSHNRWSPFEQKISAPVKMTARLPVTA
jgi:hypothetical protein